MNRTRILKEFRLLALPWLLALVAIPFVYGFNRATGDNMPWELLGGVCYIQTIAFNMMSAFIFGSEYGHQTMERLLAHPLPRLRIWREKLGILAFLMAICLLVDAIYCVWRFSEGVYFVWIFSPRFVNHKDQFEDLGYVFLYACLSFSTGPRVTFHVKQTQTAFCATLVLPIASFVLFLALAGLAQLWIRDLVTKITNDFVIVGFGIVWSFTAYYLGRRKFLNLEV